MQNVKGLEEVEEVEEAKEVEDEERMKKIREIEDRSARGQNSWRKGRYPTPGCFVDVCQKKGDAGASVRIYVKAKGLRGICWEMEERGRKRGAPVRIAFELTCASI